jgi:hypothetical protein
MTLKLNVGLLRKIQKYIMAEPRRFTMGTYHFRALDASDWKHEFIYYKDMSKSMPPCRTAACIAGWAGILSADKKFRDAIRAHELLRLPKNWLSNGFVHPRNHPLFFAENWPSQFYKAYNTSKTPRERAKVACDRIDYLIKTGK